MPYKCKKSSKQRKAAKKRAAEGDVDENNPKRQYIEDALVINEPENAIMHTEATAGVDELDTATAEATMHSAPTSSDSAPFVPSSVSVPPAPVSPAAVPSIPTPSSPTPAPAASASSASGSVGSYYFVFCRRSG
ncbi:hypothetical protein MMC14_003209 [Varicellaria rhodocarpa]|nr:hypothetical protein [Varicellaria rhodocarpa]